MQNLKSMLGVAIVAASLMVLAVSMGYAQPAQTTWTHTNTNVTTSTTAVLAANVERKWALIENVSDINIVCEIDGGAAVLTSGFTLGPLGSMEISPGLGNFTTEVINCIHGGTGNKVMKATEAQ